MKTCETCENRDNDRFSVPCSWCCLNDKYTSHYREHSAVKAYKEEQEQTEEKAPAV